MNRVQELEREYLKLMHAMQTGVAIEMENGVSDAHTPKHLRVGVNSCAVSDAALVKVLVANGVLKLEQYWEAMVAQAQEEVDSYESRLEQRLGRRVTLA